MKAQSLFDTFVKMLLFSVLLLAVVSPIHSQTWVSRARVSNGTEYFQRLMQETMFEMERREWSSLKLLDITQNLNAQMYGWLVHGTVTYSNGFLVSIQKIDVGTVVSTVSNRNVNDAANTFVNLRGPLNFRDMKIGYDVKANLTNEGVQHFTGIFNHLLTTFECSLERNINTGDTTAAVRVTSLSGNDRMVYMPPTNVTEVLSRQYVPSGIWNGVQAWGTDVIRPIMLEVAARLEFPDVCFNC